MPESPTKARTLEEELFVSTYLKNGCNATKAYLELHPDVSYRSAKTLGSRWLTKVDLSDALASHGMGIETYLNLFKQGLDATNTMSSGKKVPDNPVREKYHKRLGKILGWER